MGVPDAVVAKEPGRSPPAKLAASAVAAAAAEFVVGQWESGARFASPEGGIASLELPGIADCGSRPRNFLLKESQQKYKDIERNADTAADQALIPGIV